jgi:hypothetical protein
MQTERYQQLEKSKNSPSGTETKYTTHSNKLASTLLEEEEPRRMKRLQPTDLTTIFS